MQVSLGGLLLTTQLADHRIRFLSLYAENGRGKALRKASLALELIIKDTAMRLVVENLTLSHSVKLEGYTRVDLTGHAHQYKITTAQAGLGFGYYGTTSGVPVTPEELPAAETTNSPQIAQTDTAAPVPTEDIVSSPVKKEESGQKVPRPEEKPGKTGENITVSGPMKLADPELSIC